jgi:two-component system OmpR family response regulator
MLGRILIAEEQVECCQLFKMFLERCGYEVTTVHDGMSCVEALQDGAAPDVLILSWELPWGESEGVLDWLNQQGFDDTAVVVLTARMDNDTWQQELSLAKVTWVQRPFRLMELLDAVQTAERVPRNGSKCLEALWRKTTRPVNGVLFDSKANTEDLVNEMASVGSTLVQDQ